MTFSRNGMLATAMAMTLTAGAAQGQALVDCAARGGTIDHTVEIHLFGFFPDQVWVCPGDRVRFVNVTTYQVGADIPGHFEGPDDGDSATEDPPYTGWMSNGNFSSWITLTGISGDLDLVQDLRYYRTYPQQAALRIGVAPLKYAAGERYTDPEN